MYYCKECLYLTDRKYNLQRHIRNKHITCVQIMLNSENVQNVCPNVQNVCPPQKNAIISDTKCETCNKFYKTKRHLLKHMKKCKKVDNLTCPRCMISFTTRSAKYKHIKSNKCKARSIIHARTPNVQNITYNNIINNNLNINNNNLNINNFGYERTDYISQDQIHKILVSGVNTLPLYIQMKNNEA